jgi:hypothetical protein
MVAMIARIQIKGNKIVNVTLEREGEILPTQWTDTSYSWGKRWKVDLEYECIRCVSTRPAKNGGKNTVEYIIAHNGAAKSILRTNDSSKIVRIDRVFKTPGNFDGVLQLVYNENGKRWGDFTSVEEKEYCRNRNLDCIIRKDPDEFQLEVRGRNIGIHCTRKDDITSWSTASFRRTIETNGDLVLDSNNERVLITTCGADWLVLQKYHKNSGRLERVLFTKKSFVDLPNIGTNSGIATETNNASKFARCCMAMA